MLYEHLVTLGARPRCHPIGYGLAFYKFELSAKDLRKRRLNEPHEARQALVLGSTGSCIMFAALVTIFNSDHVVVTGPG